MESAIEVKGLNKMFGNVQVLENVNLTVKKGDTYGLLGANGAGKTTLMKIMLNLLKPSGGSVKVLGADVSEKSSKVLGKVGNIIEVPVFYDSLTVKENLDIHCDYINDMYKKEISKTLDLVGLQNVENKKVKELSLGMKQRLAIGRAILCKPDVLILDEPINGLDPKGIVEMRELITKLRVEEEVTIIISSHIISEIERVADTIGILHNGRLIEEIHKPQIQDENFSLENHLWNIVPRHWRYSMSSRYIRTSIPPKRTYQKKQMPWITTNLL